MALFRDPISDQVTVMARPIHPNGTSSASRNSSLPDPGPAVYSYDSRGTNGGREMVDLLGGKGANLAEMCRLGLPVPPGFTITTEVCNQFLAMTGAEAPTYPDGVEAEIRSALQRLSEEMGQVFGDPHNPLLVSVRSGARVSMPGMMDTVLNLGLNDITVEGLAKRSGSGRFAWDAYRRFVQMYADVVLEVKAESSEHECPFRAALEAKKVDRGIGRDTDLTEADLRELVAEFKAIVVEHTGATFPDDPVEQLDGAIAAVFRSWNNERAIAYRRMHGIAGYWGTAVSVVAMVFGNMGEDSGTGVAFTRNPANGERRFYGEYLVNAQGEDVVAGIRTPQPIATLEQELPEAWAELQDVQAKLETHYRDMQDLEFTVQEGRLFMLQCRTGKRTGLAAVRIACDLVKEGVITPEEAILRVDPESLNQLLAPVFEESQLEAAKTEGRLLTRGLNAGPGAATGLIALTPEAAERMAAVLREDGSKTPVILARIETSPEDIKGMQASVGILTARGGMTSHAALVARQMGRVCVAGAGEVLISYANKTMTVGDNVLREGDWLSLDGTTGAIYAGQVDTRPSKVLAHILEPGHPHGDNPIVQAYVQLMAWADERRTMGVRANADQPNQALEAVALGAEGIGLTRTEHMFFGEEKIDAVREMILAEDKTARDEALTKLLPLQRADFEGVFRAMGERPVTIRTLDPPLHEFLPHDEASTRELAERSGLNAELVLKKVASLAELNPMLGHRGCRLGLTFPEITRTQARAIFEAALNVAAETGVTPKPEIMIPLICTAKELELQEAIVREVAAEVFAERGTSLPYLVGTMIELPRAALRAADIAKHAEFFSFGTNDLTQTTFGISRDDAGKFIPAYIEADVFAGDPFASLDIEGVGELMEIAAERGRSTRPQLKLGICGEHGGDPKSIEFCQALGLEYVSCSAFRLPIARLAAAQAALRAAN